MPFAKKSSTIIQVALDRHHIGENCLVCGSQVRPSVFEELEQGQSQAATSSNYLNPNLLSNRFIKLESRHFITLSYFVDTTLILTILLLRLILCFAPGNRPFCLFSVICNQNSILKLIKRFYHDFIFKLQWNSEVGLLWTIDQETMLFCRGRCH